MPTKSITERKEALRVVLGAKKVLRKRGWFGGTSNGGDGASCALMALNEAATNGAYLRDADTNQDELASCMVLDEANRLHRPKDYVEKGYKFDCIVEWNDDGPRTKRQVTDVFTKVAKKLFNSLPEKDRKPFEGKV